MRIKSCRICGYKNLIKIGSLGKIAISDFTDKPEEGKKFPLELVYCEQCTLLQLAHNTPRNLLYKDYWYKSGLNPVVVNDLKEIAALAQGRNHLDIGGNDGTLLKYSKAKYKISVDPSNITPLLIPAVQNYFEDVELMNTFDTITAIACLYDLPDPNQFIKNVKRHLASGGLFISQFQPLEQMIKLNDVGNICHEHLEYYSYNSLVYLFEQNGLEIFKVERNRMNGGSYRVFARHYKKGSISFQEKEYSVQDLFDFMKRIEEIKYNFLNWLEENQPTLYGYGASTKANTILQYYGISGMKIVDVNPNKKGKYTINTNCEVIDYIPSDTEYLWVFPYGFLEYFKKREKNYKRRWVTNISAFKIS